MKTFSRRKLSSRSVAVDRTARGSGVHESGHPLFPTFDGEPWRNRVRLDPREKVKRAFLDAYFQINLAYGRLVALRKRHRSKVPHALERRILRDIERALVARETLDDRHASRGVFVAPVYQDGFAIDLRFHDGRSGPPKNGSVIVYSSSVRLTIPLPAGFAQNRAKINP